LVAVLRTIDETLAHVSAIAVLRTIDETLARVSGVDRSTLSASSRYPRRILANVFRRSVSQLEVYRNDGSRIDFIVALLIGYGDVAR